MIAVEHQHQGWAKQLRFFSKNAPHESGRCVPIMVSWLSRLKLSRHAKLAYILDILPMIATTAKLETPSSWAASSWHGVDLLDQPAREDRTVEFGVTHASHHINRGGPDATLQSRWCIEGEWKLLLSYPSRDNSN